MLAAAIAPAAAASGTAAWSRGVTALSSGPIDVGPLVAAGGPSGASALGFSLGDADTPGSAVAAILTARHGRFGRARRIAGADSVLAAEYLSRRLVALVGAAPSGTACCSSVAGLVVAGGALRAGRPFLNRLDGAVQAALVPDGRRLLAVIATDRGVWASLSSTDGRRFGSPRRLSGLNQSPQSVAAVPDGLAGANGVTIAFSARTGGLTADGPGEIFAARAAAGRLPGRPRLAVRMPGGHAVDELGLAPAAKPELAWVESDVDGGGVFRSVVHAAPLGSGAVRGRTISSSRSSADGLSMSGGARGPVIVAWRACSRGGGCSVVAAVARVRAGRTGTRPAAVFSSPLRLGGIDADQVPATASSGDGTPFAGWIGGGAVRAVRAGGGRFGRPSVLIRSAYATGLAMSESASDGAQAAWVQGTARQRVVVATWSTR